MDYSEIIERFRRGAEILAVATTGASNPELDYLPAPGKWTARQIACHLADGEVVLHMRLRQIVAEDNPTLMAYDQNAWSERLDHKTRKISLALETFRRMRGENHELAKSLPAEAFARTGNHSERGKLTLGQLLQGAAEHTERHVRQILEVRQVYKQSKGQK